MERKDESLYCRLNEDYYFHCSCNQALTSFLLFASEQVNEKVYDIAQCVLFSEYWRIYKFQYDTKHYPLLFLLYLRY